MPLAERSTRPEQKAWVAVSRMNLHLRLVSLLARTLHRLQCSHELNSSDPSLLLLSTSLPHSWTMASFWMHPDSQAFPL